MMVLGNHTSSDGSRSLGLWLEVDRRLWPWWHYNGALATVEVQGNIFRRALPATRFTSRELAAIRHAEEVLRQPSPLLFATLLEQLGELTPIRWVCWHPVDVADVVKHLRRRAVVS